MTAPTLAGIVSEVLSIPESDLDTSFFGLGGDSASAINVVRRLRRHAGIDMDPMDLLTCDSVAVLSDSLLGRVDPGENPPTST
ncbi:MAG: acyl carrier protein [Mycolicibacterium sp.]|uniref:acyl carrier protein n=1 Tax=Mycolicibacterium sp. TaxID=2320850 RepID=UPI003D0B6CA9